MKITAIFLPLLTRIDIKMQKFNVTLKRFLTRVTVEFETKILILLNNFSFVRIKKRNNNNNMAFK